MADDWQVGDLALCVSNGPDPDHWHRLDGGPKIGSIHAVVSLDRDRRGFWLSFEEWDGPSFLERGFRKIRPLTDEERDSFIVDLDVPSKVEA